MQIDASASKADIIAALELDDDAASSSKDDQDVEHKALATSDGIPHRRVPSDLNEYSGRYKYLPTGEVFGLKVLAEADVRSRKTHHAKNALKFWDGTPEEFRANFDKL